MPVALEIGFAGKAPMKNRNRSGPWGLIFKFGRLTQPATKQQLRVSISILGLSSRFFKWRATNA